MNSRKLIDEILDNSAPHAAEGAEEAYSEVTELVQQWVAGEPDVANRVGQWLVAHGMVKDSDEVYVEPGSREHGVVHVFVYPAGTSDSSEVPRRTSIITLNPNGMVDVMNG
jgi:hypothetical protein